MSKGPLEFLELFHPKPKTALQRFWDRIESWVFLLAVIFVPVGIGIIIGYNIK